MTTFLLAPITLLYTLPSALLTVYLTRVFLTAFHHNFWRIPGPFFAKFSPLWRVWFVCDGSAHEGYRELHRIYGPIVRTAPRVVDVADPGVVGDVYGVGTRFVKSQFYAPFALTYDDRTQENMFTLRDPIEHKRIKRPVASKYSMSSLRHIEYLVDPCSTLFTSSMYDLQGQVVDLGAWLQWYAFDVAASLTFSEDFGFMRERRDVHGVIAGLKMGMRYMSVVGQVPWMHGWLLGSLWVQRGLRWWSGGEGEPLPAVTEMATRHIEQYDAAAAQRTGRADFLAFLMAQREGEHADMSFDDLWSHLMDNLLAGSDTTAIALRAVFYYLLKNPQTYQTLQREIDQAADSLSPIITYAESLRLEYLQAVLKEALRLCPAVGLPLERFVPIGGANICGVHLPAGTIVGVNAAVIHRDTSVFGADANAFRPERWLQTSPNDGERIKKMERCNLTFGAGARTCIGKNISTMEMGKLVPQVLRQFDLEWAADEEEWRVKTWWFSYQEGLLVRMRPRDGGGGS